MYLRWTRPRNRQGKPRQKLYPRYEDFWQFSDFPHESHPRETTLTGAKLHIADLIGIGGAVFYICWRGEDEELIAGVPDVQGVASILCLIMGFLGHFKPHLKETRKTVLVKECLFGFACIFWLAVLIPAAVFVGSRSAKVTKAGVPAAVIAQIVALSGQKLAYKYQKSAIAFTVVGWIAFLSTCINLVLVSLAGRYVVKHGPDGEQGELVGRPHHTHPEDASIEKRSHPDSPISDSNTASERV
ncbi:hypothetical protein P7C70_g2566, partial [Phenoliferia sp. Uapishka_3]